MFLGSSLISFYAVKISTCSVRGRGENFGGSASRASLEPINCANKSFCCRNSATTSGDGGKTFSTIIGILSRMEKFNAKMKTQTAARLAHAFGCGQNNSRHQEIRFTVELSSLRFAVLAADSAAAKVPARHLAEICRNGWRESFCSNSFI